MNKPRAHGRERLSLKNEIYRDEDSWGAGWIILALIFPVLWGPIIVLSMICMGLGAAAAVGIAWEEVRKAGKRRRRRTPLPPRDLLGRFIAAPKQIPSDGPV
jgi:hypothetical protein